MDLVEVDAVQQFLVAPLRHGLGQEGVQRAVAELWPTLRRILSEALADPVFADDAPALSDLRLTASNAPAMARAFLELHRAYRDTHERLASLDEALGREDAQALGGGQTLIPTLKQRLSAPSVLVSLGAIAEIKGVCTGDDGALCIGGGTTHATVAKEASAYPGLAALAGLVVAPAVVEPQQVRLGVVEGTARAELSRAAGREPPQRAVRRKKIAREPRGPARNVVMPASR